jgi:hypothetical protein
MAAATENETGFFDEVIYITTITEILLTGQLGQLAQND